MGNGQFIKEKDGDILSATGDNDFISPGKKTFLKK